MVRNHENDELSMREDEADRRTETHDSSAFDASPEPWPYRHAFSGDYEAGFLDDACDEQTAAGDVDDAREVFSGPLDDDLSTEGDALDEGGDGFGDHSSDARGASRESSFVPLAHKPAKRASEKPVLIACVAVVAVAAALGAAALFFTGGSFLHAKGEPETVEIEAALYQDAVCADGTVGPIETVDVSAGVSGVIEEMLIAEGDTVAAGDVVARIRNDDLYAASSYAQSEYDACRSAHEAAEEPVRVADERWERAAQEVREGKRPAEEMAAFDDALETARQIEADAAHALESAQNALHDATVAAGGCEVRAPKSGIVAKVGADVGAFAASQDVLVSIDVVSAFAVRATVSGPRASLVSVGQTVDITFSDIPEAQRSGTVMSVELASLDGQGQTAAADGQDAAAAETYDVVISLRSQDQRIRPGMQAHVSIHVGDALEAFFIPSTAIVQEGDETYVIRRADGASERVSVTVLGDVSETCAVQGAIVAGDRIVVDASLP